MITGDASLSESSALVFSKGLRVTQDNEEFQRVWPVSQALRHPVERRLDNWNGWPELLADLYKLSPSKVEAQHCLLLDHSTATLVAVRRIRDAHRRPTVVVLCLTSRVNWNEEPGQAPLKIAELADESQGVVGRLAIRFESDPREVAAQLRHGHTPFERAPLGTDDNDGVGGNDVGVDRDYWLCLVQEICRYRGVEGASTPALVSLGANVVIGTAHEAKVATMRSVRKVVGYYSRQQGRLVALDDRLVPWSGEVGGPVSSLNSDEPSEPVVTAETSGESATAPSEVSQLVDAAYGIEAALREQLEQRRRMEGLTERFFTWMFDQVEFWFPRKSKKGKRK